MTIAKLLALTVPTAYQGNRSALALVLDNRLCYINRGGLYEILLALGAFE